MAEELGVFAEPEMLTWHLGLADRYIIIASDGVFEFLTSQAVVDMLSNVGDGPGDIVEGTLPDQCPPPLCYLIIPIPLYAHSVLIKDTF